jgi:dipeptidyl aminopeptidase/acylaminoacyl peptidase
MKNIAVLVLFLSTLCPVFSAQAEDTKRPVRPEDLLSIREASDVQLSRSGKSLAFVLTSIDPHTHKEFSNLWLSSDGGAPKQLTEGEYNDSLPRWAPNGRRLAFASNRDGESAIWIADSQTGKIRKLVEWRQRSFFISKAGEMFAWSPDSSEIAFAAVAPANTPSVQDPRVIDRTQYKSRTSFSDDLCTQLFIVSVADGKTRQVTFGKSDVHSLSWSSRGEIAFLSNRSPDPDRNFHYDIFSIDPRTGHDRKLTDAVGVAFTPVWSPDGQSIAYTATTRKVTTIDSIAEDMHLWVTSRDGGAARELSGALDRRVSSPQWSPDGRTIYFLLGNKGETDIFAVPLQGGQPHAVVQGPATVRAYSVAAARLAYTRTDDLTPVEVWVAGSDGGAAHAISSFNTQLSKTWELSPPHEFWFKSFDQTPVQGWLMSPLHPTSNQRYPLILVVHGGPHGMYGHVLDMTYQVEAAHGYGVLYMNPRGSSGYGQAFSDGCVKDWGGGDYKYLIAGLDYVIEQNSWIDPGRLAITGLSYGGYMTNWAITQTDRFKAAVAAGSLSNLVAFYGTSLYQDLIEAEFNGMPWDDNNYELLWRHSPLAFVKNARTPTLFVHGELDNDVPISEAEQMYTALKRQGVPAVLLRYPREGHGLREPLHRVDQINRSIAWFDEYVRHSDLP